MQAVLHIENYRGASTFVLDTMRISKGGKYLFSTHVRRVGGNEHVFTAFGDSAEEAFGRASRSLMELALLKEGRNQRP